MSTEEIIARLDMMEQLLFAYQKRLRLLRYDLCQTLDSTRESVVD